MTTPIAYLNGKFLAAEDLAIPPTDAGFVLGVTVAEQLRTFGERLFRLPAHMKRLSRSLEVVQVDPGVSISDLTEAALYLAHENHQVLATGDDLGLAIFVTPGDYGTFSPFQPPRPRVGMHTYPIPFSLWADKYTNGQRMVVTETQQVPADCWPTELKCRSRMHYYLADRQAQAIDPQARALLLDRDGFVSEASTANVVAFFADEGLVSPPREKILPGISIAVLGELAESLRIPLVHRDLRPDELFGALELLLCSTTPCLLPVTSLNGRPVGRGTPGEVFLRLIKAWSDMVEVDIVAQAVRFAERSSRQASG